MKTGLLWLRFVDSTASVSRFLALFTICVRCNTNGIQNFFQRAAAISPELIVRRSLATSGVKAIRSGKELCHE